MENNQIFKREYSEILVLGDGVTEVINPKNFLWFSDTIIETGTCSGAGIDRFLEAGYGDIRSVELDRNWFEISSNRFRSNQMVKILFGDSREKMKDMLPDKPAVVLLDAHPAGPGTAGHEDFIKHQSSGTLDQCSFLQEKIIYEEISIVSKSDHKHLIIVDDQHSTDPNIINLLPGYQFELVNKKYLVCIPKN